MSFFSIHLSSFVLSIEHRRWRLQTLWRDFVAYRDGARPIALRINMSQDETIINADVRLWSFKSTIKNDCLGHRKKMVIIHDNTRSNIDRTRRFCVQRERLDHTYRLLSCHGKAENIWDLRRCLYKDYIFWLW